jgi:hypothetical protein
MDFQEWIGSLISLLAFAALFFLNKRKMPPQHSQAKNPQIQDEEDEEDDWTKFLKDVGGEQAKKKSPPPPQPKPKLIKKSAPLPEHQMQKKPKSFPAKQEEEHLEIYKSRPVLRSAHVMRLNRIPLIGGEIPEQSPKIRQIFGKLPDLKKIIISREVLEKPRGWH